MNKKILLAVVALLVVVGVLLGVYFASQNSGKTPDSGEKTQQDQNGQEEGGEKETPKAKSFRVIVVHKDESTKEFTYEYTDNETVLGEQLQKEGLISGDEGPYGLYIKEVDGEQAVYETDGAYWGFYVGEDYATAGIDKTTVSDGAVYKLVYTVG